MLTWWWVFFLLCEVPELVFSRDPWVDAELAHLVRSLHYPFETHEVVTRDGYILGLHRLPSKRPGYRPPALLMHGLLGSSADWVSSGVNVSLAYLLHDYGYDVWLGSNRGTTFSKGHVRLHTRSSRYWDFSWNELGLYDTPAIIDYVLDHTNQPKLYYVGFSQGCTQFFVMTSMRPEYNDKVILMTALAPAAYIGNVKGMVKLGSVFVSFASAASQMTSYFEFMPNIEILEQLFTFACRKGSFSEPACKMSIFLLAGYGLIEEWAEEDIPVILKFAPAGCSTKQLLHYGQGAKNPGTFRQYDYGIPMNLMVYRSLSPPDYPLEKISTPTVIFSGTNDFLADPEDVDLLADKLPNLVERREVSVKQLNHFDFIFGNHIRSLVYDDVVENMESFLAVTN